MVNPQQVIDESRPMLEEFLSDIGIHQPGQPIANTALLDSFSDWLDAQEIPEEDFWYVSSRVAAFICEYLIEGFSAVRYIQGQGIFLRLPIDTTQQVYRDFDPHSVAVSLVRERKSLKQFLHILTA
jgi:hypothetical protein